MRHTLMGPATMVLWALNVALVAAIHWWPIIDRFDSAQRLLLGVTIAVTVAWLMRRPGIEYRIGYRQGREDNDK